MERSRVPESEAARRGEARSTDGNEKKGLDSTHRPSTANLAWIEKKSELSAGVGIAHAWFGLFRVAKKIKRSQKKQQINKEEMQVGPRTIKKNKIMVSYRLTH